MTETVTVALIVATPPTIASVAALIMSIRNGNKIHDVHVGINSRMDELVKASKAQGRQDERDSHSITVQGFPERPDAGE
jgi:hypothetical protein